MTSSFQPLQPGRALVAARDMARYFSGGPFLLVSTRLAPPLPPGLGAETILVDVGRDIRFFFQDSVQADDFAEAPQLPSDLLAIVATSAETAPLRALWTERGLVAPPLIAVASLQEAIGPIVARAKEEIAAAAVRHAELQRALVATRAEFEETRSAMHGVMRTLSHRYAVKMNLVAAVAPLPAKTATVEALETLQRVYPVATEGVTCLALHISALRTGAKAFLRVLLFGAESGRMLGEWRRPGDALCDGWNSFDLPTPVAAIRETFAIAVSLIGDSESTVSLSLGDGAGREGLFAIRIWTADAGGRFPHARHWIWSAPGAIRPPSGTASLVDADTIGRIVRRGSIEAMQDCVDGAAASYRIRGGSSLLCLQGVSVPDAEAICIELMRGIGDLNSARFNLTVQAEGRGLASGWRSFGVADNTLKLGVSLPTTLPDTVDLYLRIEAGDCAASGFATVAIRHIEVVTGKRDESLVDLDEIVDPGLIPPSPNEEPVAVNFSAIRASNYTETDKYAWLQITVDGLSFNGRIEDKLKFKVGLVDGGRISLEFRQGQNWPRIFEQWPGRRQDRFGEMFRVTRNGDELSIAGSLATEADKNLLAAVCSLLPAIVRSGVQNVPAAKPRLPAWLEAAHAFAVAARRTFQDSAG
ncbi:MAG TPA: DUF6212 domain-containing protein [Rhizomicrobium sp.]